MTANNLPQFEVGQELDLIADDIPFKAIVKERVNFYTYVLTIPLEDGGYMEMVYELQNHLH